MLVERYISFLIILTIHFTKARPPSTPERILTLLNKRNTTASSSKSDCTNIFMLIDNQAHLLKCLFEEYTRDDDGVIFPDSDETNEDKETLRSRFEIRGVPPCARKGATFCEDADNYPHHQVKIAMKNSTLVNFFGVDPAPNDSINRVGVDEDKYLCQAEQRIIFPKVAKTRENIWKYVVNQEKSTQGYIQGIHVEICKYLDEPCDLLNSVPNGYVTSCKQKYMYRRLLSISDQGATVNEFFEMPSACCCSYRRDMKYLLRSNVAISSGRNKNNSIDK